MVNCESSPPLSQTCVLLPALEIHAIVTAFPLQSGFSNGACPHAYVLHYLQQCPPNTSCTCLLDWRRSLLPLCHFQLLLTHSYSWRRSSEACSCSSKYSSWSTSKQSFALETNFSKELLISSSLAFCCLACLRQLYTASNASTPSFPMADLGINITEKVK